MARSSSNVRDALDGSVTKAPPRTPPESIQSNHVSIVAKLGALARVSESALEHPPHLGRREVGVEDEPGRLSHARTVTFALRAPGRWRWCVGPARRWPAERCRRDLASKPTVVSRWLVTPRATTSWPLRRAARGHLAQRGDGEIGDLQGVVFDLAGGGEVLGQLAVATRRRRRGRVQRRRFCTPVVPASRARTSCTGVRLAEARTSPLLGPSLVIGEL